MQALILAGGKGTRLRPLTLYTPKPIVPIANRSFLCYQLDLLKRAGVKSLILSLSYKPEKIIDIFGDGVDLGLEINYTVEQQPLGTAGAFKNAERQIKSSTIVLNGDILTDIDLSAVLALHRERKASATIVLVPVENPSAYGLVETSSDGRVLRFIEKPDPAQIVCNTINAGLYILEPSVLKYIPANTNHSFEYGLFPRLIAEGEPFYAYVSRDYWLDIGTNARYLQANLDVLAGKLSYRPERARSEKWGSNIDELSLIESNCLIKGAVEITNSVIGPGCVLADGVKIRDSVLLQNIRVDANSSINGSVLGRGCYVGASAHLTPGTVLGDRSSVTDFSQVGSGKL
jgi:mannose-1-phosphate guanylyltransferase